MMRLASDQLDWCETGHICEKVVIDKKIDIDTTRHGWTKLGALWLDPTLHPPPSQSPHPKQIQVFCFNFHSGKFT